MGSCLLLPGESDKDRDVNIAQPPLPPIYGENDSNLQNVRAECAISKQIAGVPATGVRHCTTYALPPQYVALLQRNTRNVDGN